jgi:hypothetical protein
MMNRTMHRRAFAIAGLGVVFGARAALALPATPASPVPAGAELYRVDLTASSLPSAPIAVGAAGVSMTPGTAVVYAKGAAKQSVAIDHVLAGGYNIETDSELLHIDKAGNLTHIDAGQTTTVAAGESVVILHNEAEQRITVGDEETRTLTVGFFSLQRGTNETTVKGTLKQTVLGGTLLNQVPASGVIATVVPAADASRLTSAVAQIPVTLGAGEAWVVVVLPLTGAATPAA